MHASKAPRLCNSNSSSESKSTSSDREYPIFLSSIDKLQMDCSWLLSSASNINGLISWKGSIGGSSLVPRRIASVIPAALQPLAIISIPFCKNQRSMQCEEVSVKIVVVL